jgi:hypothetical protein
VSDVNEYRVKTQWGDQRVRAYSAADVLVQMRLVDQFADVMSIEPWEDATDGSLGHVVDANCRAAGCPGGP